MTDEALQIARQGVFSAGGTTQQTPGTFDPVHGQMASAGQTRHSDHASVFFQIPAGGNGRSLVFLHGYGQSRTGWMGTPDGREGFSDLFLRKGLGVYLVDEPRRGAAGQSSVPVTIPATPDDRTGLRSSGWACGRTSPRTSSSPPTSTPWTSSSAR